MNENLLEMQRASQGLSEKKYIHVFLDPPYIFHTNDLFYFIKSSVCSWISGKDCQADDLSGPADHPLNSHYFIGRL